MTLSKERLDAALVRLGLAPSRERAQAMVLAGCVLVDGATERKPSRALAQDASIVLARADHPYVSRGGLKLAGALDALGVDPARLVALDVGASTGGFTDCLLTRGAARVYAIDVGRGQLADRLRHDARVIATERKNARNLVPADVGEPIDLATIDVSFISLSKILPAVVPCVRPGGRILGLVKPQFEAPRGEAKHGVVRDEEVRQRAIESVARFAAALGLSEIGRADSAVRGPKGNLETFVLWRVAG